MNESDQALTDTMEKKSKILLVEDEAIVALEICGSIKGMGYEVVDCVDTAEKAIAAALEKEPDIVLMDIHIKGKTDGIEAANRIKQEKRIPVIFLTAYTEGAILDRAKRALPVGYLVKPVQEKDLRVTLETVLYVSKVNRERDEALEQVKKAHEELELKIQERTRALREEIDRRRQTEQALHIAKNQAEGANQAKSAFLANVSHELRNPMHQIIAFSKNGDEKFDFVDDDKRRHYFKQIRKSAARLMVLVNNLLDFSKFEAGNMELKIAESDIQTLIEEATSEFKPTLEEKQLSIQVRANSSSGKITCDSYKVGQVIRNLLSNAIAYSHPGGKIYIELSDECSSLDNDNQMFRFSISDEGVGIPIEETEKIFKDFYQSSRTKTNAGGTGLGLAICKDIIEIHRGRIWAENNLDKGATFCFTIPQIS